jgi:ferritin
MKMSAKLEKAFNEQMKNELESEYIYYAMASYFESANLTGMAKWMEKQSEEEHKHGMKFYKFMVERGNRAVFSAFAKPQTDWKSAEDAFLAALKHEQFITKSINDLLELSLAEKDHASASFLKWFVDEQVEEEQQTDEILQKLKMAKDSSAALMFIDSFLGKRE